MGKIIIVLKYLIIGIVQGIAEILPVSSSGHLIIVSKLLNMSDNDLTFEIFLHFASLIAIVFFFRHKLWLLIKDFFLYIFKKNEESQKNFKIAIYLIVATIPAAIVGFLLDDIIEANFTSLLWVGIFLIITALFLLLSSNIDGEKTMDEMKWYNALIIGLFQCFGLFPGISRSGSTITGGKTQRLIQSDAAEFAFLLAIPIMLGSAILKIGDISEAFQQTELIIPYIISFIASLVFTYLSIKYILVIIRKYELSVFSWYCATLGVVLITIHLLY